MQPVVEGAEGCVLEHQLQPPVIIVVTIIMVTTGAHRHQQQDVGVRDQAEVLQLPGLGLLLDSHLGQVPQLAHQPRPGALPSLVTDLASLANLLSPATPTSLASSSMGCLRAVMSLKVQRNNTTTSLSFLIGDMCINSHSGVP